MDRPYFRTSPSSCYSPRSMQFADLMAKKGGINVVYDGILFSIKNVTNIQEPPVIQTTKKRDLKITREMQTQQLLLQVTKEDLGASNDNDKDCYKLFQVNTDDEY